MFGLYNVGNAIQKEIWLEQAVRAGGIRALSAGDNADLITTAVQHASWKNVSVTTMVAPSPTCPDGSTLQSNGDCASGPTFQFITITATVPFVSVGIPLPLMSLGAQYVEQLP